MSWKGLCLRRETSTIHSILHLNCCLIPIGSMYGIFTYIYHKSKPNVGKYTIHRSDGIVETSSLSSFFKSWSRPWTFKKWLSRGWSDLDLGEWTYHEKKNLDILVANFGFEVSPMLFVRVKKITRWWFQIFFIFTPIWGRFPFWLIFFRWVEPTNQLYPVP